MMYQLILIQLLGTKTPAAKDNTPTTGYSVDILGYVIIATLLSFMGIVILKKKMQ